MQTLSDSLKTSITRKSPFSPQRDLSSLPTIPLPIATLPFNPLPTPRKNIKPIGAKPLQMRLEEERYLHTLLQLIADANPATLTGILAPQNFRFEYDHNLTKTANVDLTNLVITVSDKFFRRIENDAQAAAILCHEVSHIIRGHEEFLQPPPCVLTDPRYKRAALELEAATKHLAPETSRNIFSRYDTCSDALKKQYYKAYPGELEALEAQRKHASGDEGRKIYKLIQSRLEAFAYKVRTPEAKNFLEALKNERNYERNLEKWKMARHEQHKAIDKILGEENASFNWHEQEADELGLRLFMRAGFRADDFLQTLARTLDKGTNELHSYLTELKKVKNPATYKLPPRGNSNHPSPKWRLANLAIRELRLRYPKEYQSLAKSAPKISSDQANPLGNWLSTIKNKRSPHAMRYH